MAGCVVDTLSTLKGLAGENRFNSLALVVAAKKAWYVYASSATDSADNDVIVAPNDNTGRWFKCNNTSNILNTANTQNTSSGTTVVDFTNYEEVCLIFSQNTTINFQATIRNGYGFLVLNRNGGVWTISGWDARIRFPSSSYNFSSGVNIAILNLVFFNNLIYVTKVTEYA